MEKFITIECYDETCTKFKTLKGKWFVEKLLFSLCHYISNMFSDIPSQSDRDEYVP